MNRLLFFILSFILLAAQTVNAQEEAPVDAPVPAVVPEPGSELSLDNMGSPADTLGPAGLCYFRAKGDYVHLSSSASVASGHGWWVNGNCNARFAVVTVQLQEYYSDGRWRNVGTVGRATVTSGGGRGNRATGRAGCNNNSGLASWRSVIDVDVIGVIDDPSKLTTPFRNIRCHR
jgi:hypothetical protein